MRALRDNERRLYGLLVAVLGACGGVQTSDDGGVDASNEAATCDAASCCYCFEQPVSCDFLHYSWDASFPLCSGGPPCIQDQDADCVNGFGTNYVGELGGACASADYTSGDPYPYPTGGNHFTCTEISRDLDAGIVNVTCNRLHICGRRFEGLVEAEHTGPSRCGRALAEMAWLEAASVHAFSRLARDLEAHDAPRALVDRARRAAREEARHARAMRRLAVGHGAEPRRVAARRPRRRSLEQIAIENAVEGCVRETFGALLAMWQAARARDPEVRRALEAIAPDELGHAALAWTIALWAETRLDAEAAARVRRAREAALVELSADFAQPEGDLSSALGLPSADAMRALGRALAGHLSDR